MFAAGKKDKTDTGFQEKNGIRCVRLNPSGTHIASGDRAGNVRCALLLFLLFLSNRSVRNCLVPGLRQTGWVDNII